MSIFNMVMEAMTPTYDETFCEMVAMESDLDCIDVFREACGAPAYEASNNRVRVMAATEALNQMSRHANIAANMDTPVPQKPNYSAAFEAINATLDTSINPEMREEILAKQRETALGFYDALESFMQGDDAALEGKLWDSFTNKGAGEAWKTGGSLNYQENYTPKGHKSLGDFQLHVITSDKAMNDLHARYPHIAFKRGPITRVIGKAISKIGHGRFDNAVELYWIDPVNPEDPTAAVCVATAEVNPKFHVINDVAVRSEFQGYGLMNQIIQYILKEYQCNEAVTESDDGPVSPIAEQALAKAGFVKVAESEHETCWRKGAAFSGSFLSTDKKNPC